jgi:hypothetical protein
LGLSDVAVFELFVALLFEVTLLVTGCGVGGCEIGCGVSTVVNATLSSLMRAFAAYAAANGRSGSGIRLPVPALGLVGQELAALIVPVGEGQGLMKVGG